MLRTFMGQPVHPMLVHFPVAFFIISTFFVFIHLIDGPSGAINRLLKKLGFGTFDFESFSFLALLLGFLGGLMAIFSGLALVKGWRNLPLPHGPLGISTVISYFILLVLRWVFGPAIYKKKNLKLFFILLYLAGFFLLCATGFEGGELHYK